MRLYHATTQEAAASILANGFRDTTSNYLTSELWTGVWLADRPLDGNEGAKGDTILVVDFGAAPVNLEDFEWVEEGGGPGYREWLIPAAIINESAITVLVPFDDDGCETSATS